MKAIFAITILVAVSQLASARVVTKRDFTLAEISGFVTLWATDVSNVNNFLNAVFQGSLSTNDPNDLVVAAQLAQTFATDEPLELMRLRSLPNLSQTGITAAMNLRQVFMPQVLDNLATIIANPTNNATVTTAVNAINDSRCFNVLPDLCNLWPAAFETVGLDPAQAGKPIFEDACIGIFQNAGVSPICQGAPPQVG